METRARFPSLAQSKLRLCSANHRADYFSNLDCDWLSIVWAYSEQMTENGPGIWVNIGLYNGLLPNSTKPLPKPMLTNHQTSSVAFSWEQLHRNCLRYLFGKRSWKLHPLKLFLRLPGANELNDMPDFRPLWYYVWLTHCGLLMIFWFKFHWYLFQEI